jgi:NAD-dependent SIR2 family protein deacetylase
MGRPRIGSLLSSIMSDTFDAFVLELPSKYSWAGLWSDPADAERPGPSARTPDFTSFCHTIRSMDRVFALVSHLHVSSEGRIFLRDFLVALSCVCRHHETRSKVTALAGQLEAAGWQRVSRPEPERAFRSNGFELCLRVAHLPLGIKAVHVFLGYGNTQRSLALYLEQLFPRHVSQIVPADDRQGPPSQTLPPRRTPRVIQTVELAKWLRKAPCTVLTGAGISLASGIPPFQGPGSLDVYFQVEERFPGAAFDWAVHRPAELASVIGSFQAALLTARPNPAHRALADLESLGVVKQVLTTNFDQLHQAAGSVRVKRLHSGEDWAAKDSTRALLVIGASNDAFGVVRAARAAGMEVAVLNPKAPEFVKEEDLYLPGRAEVELPRLVELLGR